MKIKKIIHDYKKWAIANIAWNILFILFTMLSMFSLCIILYIGIVK